MLTNVFLSYRLFQLLPTFDPNRCFHYYAYVILMLEKGLFCVSSMCMNVRVLIGNYASLVSRCSVDSMVMGLMGYVQSELYSNIV